MRTISKRKIRSSIEKYISDNVDTFFSEACEYHTFYMLNVQAYHYQRYQKSITVIQVGLSRFLFSI